MISIRRLRPGEWMLFKEVRLAALNESPAAFPTTYASALARSRESWIEQADSTAQGKDRCTFIAFSDGIPVGITALYRDKEKTEEGELLQVWVSPEYRGSGVAQDLLETVLRWGEENGFKRVIAGITLGNDRAGRFYLKCGFEVVDSPPGEVPGGFTFVKELTVV